MPKVCPEGKVLNPLTNRCVSTQSAIGKKILQFTERPNTTMEKNTALPTDLIQAIVSFLPEKHQNCGQLIKFLKNTKADFQTLSPTLIAQLHTSVIKTLTVFMKRVQRTSLIKLSAMHPHNMPMLQRIKVQIALAKSTLDISLLMNYCRQIVEWKREARQIMRQLHTVIGYIDTYRKTRVAEPNYMGDLVVFRNANSWAARHLIHRVHVWSDIDSPQFSKTMSRGYNAQRKNVQQDQEKLVDILKPVDNNE